MMTRRMLLVSPFLFLLASGCGTSKTGASSVSGKITYNGQKVTAGNVTLYPKEGAPVPVGIQSDGTYTSTDMIPGEYTVTVETESARPHEAPVYGGGRGGAPAKGEGGMQPGAGGMSPRPKDAQQSTGTYTKIPDKYSKKETSGLKTTVGKGKNTYDIPLTD
jgi:hypothetical protein